MEKNEISVEEAKHEIRLREWEERIKKCKASGISVKDWCRENNIGTKRYYYWHRQLWKRELANFKQTTTKPEPVRFAQIEMPAIKSPEIRIQRNGWVIEIGNEANPQLIREIMQMAGQDV